jgi:hypothetical protein
MLKNNVTEIREEKSSFLSNLWKVNALRNFSDFANFMVKVSKTPFITPVKIEKPSILVLDELYRYTQCMEHTDDIEYCMYTEVLGISNKYMQCMKDSNNMDLCMKYYKKQ